MIIGLKGHVAVASITYNQEDFVSMLVETTRAQVYDRLISHSIVDDASTDQSYNILDKYWSEDHYSYDMNRCLRTTKFESNRGSNAAFDRAIEIAKNPKPEYVALLEGDDYYYPDKIRRSVEFMEEKGYDAVATDIDADCHDGRGLIKNAWKSMGIEIPEHITYEYLSLGNRIYTCTFIARREVFNDAPTMMEFKKRGYGVLGDYPLFLWIAKRFKIGYLDEALSVKRELPLSISHNPETYNEFAQIYAKVVADAQAGLF